MYLNSLFWLERKKKTLLNLLICSSLTLYGNKWGSSVFPLICQTLLKKAKQTKILNWWNKSELYGVIYIKKWNILKLTIPLLCLSSHFCPLSHSLFIYFYFSSFDSSFLFPFVFSFLHDCFLVSLSFNLHGLSFVWDGFVYLFSFLSLH